MKRLLIFALLATLLVVAMAGNLSAQGTADTAASPWCWMAGARIDNGVFASMGIGRHLGIPSIPILKHLWVVEYVDVGTRTDHEVTTANTEFMALQEVVAGRLYIGPVLGGDLDWYNIPGDGLPATNYFALATGLSLSWRIADKFGLAGFAKNKRVYGKNSYETHWQGGVGLWWML